MLIPRREQKENKATRSSSLQQLPGPAEHLRPGAGIIDRGSRLKLDPEMRFMETAQTFVHGFASSMAIRHGLV